jgi:hypothetical protein
MDNKNEGHQIQKLSYSDYTTYKNYKLAPFYMDVCYTNKRDYKIKDEKKKRGSKEKSG